MQTTPRKPSSCMDFKNQGKNPPKQERLVFLETTVHRVGETTENQRKTREKTKVAENQVFWLDFCAKKRTVHYLSGFKNPFKKIRETRKYESIHEKQTKIRV
jgi:hypothetical protein